MLEWDVWLFANVITKFVIYLTSFVAAGSLLFLWLLKPLSDKLIKSTLIISLYTCILAAVFTVLRISVQAGQLYDEGLIGLFDLEMVNIIMEGPLGPSSYVRLTGLLLLILAIMFTAVQTSMTIIGSILVAISFAMIGHATKEQLILGSLITIHLLAVSYWIGGLYPLYKSAGDESNLNEAAELAHKFGTQATIIVPVLIFAGIAFTLILLGSPANLIGTDYGMIFFIKIATVAILLMLAALNKLRFVPDLQKGNLVAALHFKKSMSFEFIAFLSIFAITAILTTAVSLPEM